MLCGARILVQWRQLDGAQRASAVWVIGFGLLPRCSSGFPSLTPTVTRSCDIGFEMVEIPRSTLFGWEAFPLRSSDNAFSREEGGRRMTSVLPAVGFAASGLHVYSVAHDMTSC